MSSVTHVDTAGFLRVGTELVDVFSNLTATANLVADELIPPIVKKSGSEKLEAVGEDWNQISEDAKKQKEAAIAVNEDVTVYANSLADISSNS